MVLGIGDEETPYRGKIRLAAHRVWKPTPGRKLKLQEVEDYIRELDRQFNLEHVAFDPWQAEHLAQRLEYDKKSRQDQKFGFYDDDPWMAAIPPTGNNLRDIASIVIESFTDRRLALYDCDHLRTDLTRLRVEEKSYGFRLSSPRDEVGHGDVATAFSLALFQGHKVAGKKVPKLGLLIEDVDEETAFERAVREYGEEAAVYEIEMHRLHTGEDPQEELRNVIRFLGR